MDVPTGNDGYIREDKLMTSQKRPFMTTVCAVIHALSKT